MALHPMGFSVPGSLRCQRWALTPPFHPYPALAKTQAARRPAALRFQKERGGLFSVALSVRVPHGTASRVYPPPWRRLRGIAPFSVRTFLLPRVAPEKAILRPSKINKTLSPSRRKLKPLRKSLEARLRGPSTKGQSRVQLGAPVHGEPQFAFRTRIGTMNQPAQVS